MFPDLEWDSDGYPNEAFLDNNRGALRLYSPQEAWEWIKRNLETCAANCCASYSIKDATDILGDPCQHIYFSTGGWSGAETLISVIEGRIWARHLMLQWRRGGHYIFESPNDI